MSSEIKAMTLEDMKMMRVTAQVMSAYFQKNPIPARALPQMVESVYGALNSLTAPEAPAKKAPVPAVPVGKSIGADYLICLEDGKRFRSLRRHLKVAYNLTPEEYRAKWGLGPDYPMVAPATASRRSALARSMGLGTQKTAHARARREPALGKDARVSG